MIILERKVRDKITNRLVVKEILCSGFVPIRYCTKIDSGTRNYLIRRKILWIEDLMKVREEDLCKFSQRYAHKIETIWATMREKKYLNRYSQEILHYLNFRGVRLNQYDRHTITALSNFSFLYRKQDLPWILQELLPHLYCPEYGMPKRDQSKGKKIRQAFEYVQELNVA